MSVLCSECVFQNVKEWSWNSLWLIIEQVCNIIQPVAVTKEIIKGGNRTVRKTSSNISHFPPDFERLFFVSF